MSPRPTCLRAVGIAVGVLLDRVDLHSAPVRVGVDVPLTPVLATLVLPATAAAVRQGGRQTRELAGLA